LQFHKHLIDIIQHEFGNHPGYFYDFKIIEKTKEILLKADISIAAIARTSPMTRLTFQSFSKAGQARPRVTSVSSIKAKLHSNP
jgi:hypothetical protein